MCVLVLMLCVCLRVWLCLRSVVVFGVFAMIVVWFVFVGVVFCCVLALVFVSVWVACV